jgi:protein-S-isoprenylcysteine O-methyltransferase Ste14
MLATAIGAVPVGRRHRNEQRCMQQQFGQADREYRRRVAALLPLLF